MSDILQTAVAAVIEHSERHGKLWFGLIFWGSVLNAAAQRAFEPANPLPVTLAAFALGAAIGLVGHLRGRWL